MHTLLKLLDVPALIEEHPIEGLNNTRSCTSIRSRTSIRINAIVVSTERRSLLIYRMETHRKKLSRDEIDETDVVA